METSHPNELGCGCGTCSDCGHRAALKAAEHVIARCASRRKHATLQSPEQRRYLANQLTVTLAALGLAQGEEVDGIVRRSDWGKAMRARQNGS